MTVGAGARGLRAARPGRVDRSIAREVLGIAIAIAVASCSLVSTPIVSIDADLSPRLTPDQVAAKAIQEIHNMEQVAGQVATPPKVLSMAAHLIADPGGSPEIQWSVQVEGTCTSGRPLAGRVLATSCRLTISDTRGFVGVEIP
jgi:hypothetical protein